jgi:hypothetical protein
MQKVCVFLENFFDCNHQRLRFKLHQGYVFGRQALVTTPLGVDFAVYQLKGGLR